MKQDSSFGIIPLRFRNGQWEVLLVQHKSGSLWWAFPKGHAEVNESPQQTAERELFEETGLAVLHYLSSTPLTETYIFTFKGERIFKTVQYFLAMVEGQLLIEESELEAAHWMTLAEALEMITFKEGRRICQEVIDFIDKFKK